MYKLFLLAVLIVLPSFGDTINLEATEKLQIKTETEKITGLDYRMEKLKNTYITEMIKLREAKEVSVDKLSTVVDEIVLKYIEESEKGKYRLNSDLDLELKEEVDKE